MKTFLLTKVRLTWFLVIFFVIYYFLSLFMPSIQLEAPALTLFSVNSFLYGFYIAPILSAQKARIEELHRIVRSEANSIFGTMLHVKQMPTHLRNQIQQMFEDYIRATIGGKTPEAAERQYEYIITFCVTYKGAHQEEVNKLLDAVIANQQNRTLLNMQLRNKVYSNEWMIMLVLFSITLGFILMLDVVDAHILIIIKALLCTGLTMLILILAKLSTLTHKKATEIWRPFEKLLQSRFYQID